MVSSPEFHGTTNPTSGGASVSYFQRTVRLLDWWLITAGNDSNGKTLAVAGLTSKPGQPVRVFSSAPIVKRHDVFTLETADGICVVLKGFLNKLRATDNGFTPQVFKHFVFGFPPNWETHAANCFEAGASNSTAAGGNASDTDNLSCRSRSVTGNGLDHGDSMAEETMQTTSATETPAPFTGADVQDEEVENKGKKERESRKKVTKKIISDSPGSGVSKNTRGRKEKECLVSPECRSYGRSRSGRVLLPTMEFWRNQLPVYDSDRKLRGIREEQQDKKTTLTTKRKEEHRSKKAKR
ncbi:kinetochore-associated protein KNL-2 homolog [Cucumis sativus]|uniref:SANTA domain-containing protein n=1 Tax=Cucumis sativus TaxID=3659 RepID=A0A0A0KX65_CUCSA|nr:kinetochore-associated protein KNL-2 homolog [Cucumis sativus]KGN54235.1 hypothetical protein Csa_017902 [Cucumis sativus]